MRNPGGNTRQYAAWDRGYSAFNKGLTLKQNPHKGDKVSREWWQKGWDAAQQEANRG